MPVIIWISLVSPAGLCFEIEQTIPGHVGLEPRKLGLAVAQAWLFCTIRLLNHIRRLKP
ncbi:MAG: hypothetical protein U0401_21980 [Anaerolineae bacterium]